MLHETLCPQTTLPSSRLLADGHVDIVVESGLKPWDIRALEPIITNSGGILKNWEGNKILNGGSIIAAANELLFKETKKVISKKTQLKKLGF